MKKNKTERKPSGKSSLVLGILSVFPGIFLSIIGIILSVLAISFGSVQLKKTRYGKVGLILGIVSLIMNLLLTLFLFSLSDDIVSSYSDVKSMSYPEALKFCKSKTSYIEKTVCIGSVINSNKDNAQVKSGEICNNFANEEKAFCFLILAKTNSDENYCNNLEKEEKTLCLVVVRKDPSLCNQLPLTVRTKCLDFISKDY